MAIMGQQIGSDLTKALGLPRNTVSFTLRAAFNEIVSVQCEYYPDALPRDVVLALAEYTLVRKVVPVDLAPALFDFDAWLAARNELAHQAMMAQARLGARIYPVA